MDVTRLHSCCTKITDAKYKTVHFGCPCSETTCDPEADMDTELIVLGIFEDSHVDGFLVGFHTYVLDGGSCSSQLCCTPFGLAL